MFAFSWIVNSQIKCPDNSGGGGGGALVGFKNLGAKSLPWWRPPKVVEGYCKHLCQNNTSSHVYHSQVMGKFLVRFKQRQTHNSRMVCIRLGIPQAKMLEMAFNNIWQSKHPSQLRCSTDQLVSTCAARSLQDHHTLPWQPQRQLVSTHAACSSNDPNTLSHKMQHQFVSTHAVWSLQDHNIFLPNTCGHNHSDLFVSSFLVGCRICVHRDKINWSHYFWNFPLCVVNFNLALKGSPKLSRHFSSPSWILTSFK